MFTLRYPTVIRCSVGVLEDEDLSSRIPENNFEVLGLGLESRVLGLEACALDCITAL